MKTAGFLTGDLNVDTGDGVVTHHKDVPAAPQRDRAGDPRASARSGAAFEVARRLLCSYRSHLGGRFKSGLAKVSTVDTAGVRIMKYGLAWLVGIPLPLIALWFFVNHSGCGY